MDRQIDKTISETGEMVQALRTVQRYFSKDELLRLCKSLCFSKLYYVSEVWLIPNPKESLFKKMYSQSRKCLKVVDMTKSYQELHVNYHRATPKLFEFHQTSLYYSDVVNNLYYVTEEALAVQSNTVNNKRNKYLTFVRSYNYRYGLNCLSNRLKTVSNMIEKS